MPAAENRTTRPPVDMSPEAIAARIRRVVELNRLCQSLAASVPSRRALPEPVPAPSEPEHR
jgi:hypothetical protein